MGTQTLGRPTAEFFYPQSLTADINPQLAAFRQHDMPAPGQAVLRTREQVLRLFTGLDLIEPGLAPTSQWRPGTDCEASAPSAAWAGVARTT